MYRELIPSVKLKDIIQCYWITTPSQSLSLEKSHVVVPDNCIDILFIEIQSKLILLFSGPMTKPIIAPNAKIFGIRFKFEYFYGLFKIPMCEFVDAGVMLDDFYPDANNLKEIYLSENDLNKIPDKLNNYFENRITTLVENSDPRVVFTLNKLSAGHELKEVYRLSGSTEQHLRRLFKKHVGVAPKKIEKIWRFQKVINLMKNAEHQTDLTNLGLDAGYFDQSHFCHEFKELSLETPEMFMKNL